MLKAYVFIIYFSASLSLSAFNCTEEAPSSISNRWTYGTTVVQIFLGVAQVLGVCTSLIAESIYYNKALENPKILIPLDELVELREERQKLRNEEPKILLTLLKKMRVLVASDQELSAYKLKKIKDKIQEMLNNEKSIDTASL